MKYRVIEKNGRYIIQYKSFLFWRDIKVRTDYTVEYPDMESANKAMEYIKAGQC